MGLASTVDTHWKESYVRSLLSSPVACVSSALTVAVVWEAHFCPPLMSLMISVYVNSEVRLITAQQNPPPFLAYFPACLHCWHRVRCQTLYFMLSRAGCSVYFEHCSYLLLEISQGLWLRSTQFRSKFHHHLNRSGRQGKLQLTSWHYVLETWGGGSD